MSKSHSKILFLALAAAGIVCGCSSDLRYLQTLWVDDVARVYANGSDYSVDAAILKPELDAWKGAGFDGFGASLVTYEPDVCICCKFVNSAPNEWPCNDLLEACDVNFAERVVVVNEVRRNGSSQYVRDATAADRRFRQFLLSGVADGKFPKAENKNGSDAVDTLSR